MRASRRTNSILDAINCIQYPHCLYVTHRQWVIGYRRFGINLHTHLHGAKYYLICRPLKMRPLSRLETSSTDYQMTRLRKAQ